MPYRDFTLPNGRVVRTRVSDAATLDWWEGYDPTDPRPNRPPDVDTENIRSWVLEDDGGPHPEVLSAEPVGMWAMSLEIGLPSALVKALPPDLPDITHIASIHVLLARMEPGGAYVLRVIMPAVEGIRDAVTKEEYIPDNPDLVNAKIEQHLATLNEAIDDTFDMGVIRSAHWSVTTPGEVMEHDREREIAKAEWQEECKHRPFTNEPLDGPVFERGEDESQEHFFDRLRAASVPTPKGGGWITCGTERNTKVEQEQGTCEACGTAIWIDADVDRGARDSMSVWCHNCSARFAGAVGAGHIAVLPASVLSPNKAKEYQA